MQKRNRIAATGDADKIAAAWRELRKLPFLMSCVVMVMELNVRMLSTQRPTLSRDELLDKIACSPRP